jgi:hypothetical protein
MPAVVMFSANFGSEVFHPSARIFSTLSCANKADLSVPVTRMRIPFDPIVGFQKHFRLGIFKVPLFY